MAPINVTGDVIFPLIQHFNHDPVADNTSINPRESSSTDYPQPLISKPKLAAIMVGVLVIAGICVFIFCRIFWKIAERSERPMPQGHVYGHENVSYQRLATLRRGTNSARPSFQHVENSGLGDSQWGGNTVARPVPVATHGRDRRDETPPPPCK